MAQFIVTGAAGFIGANLVKALNKSGFDDVIAVDNLTKSEKFTNLAENKISDYMDKHVFLEAVKNRSLSRPEAVFHQGACSNTMEGDGHYMMENNYRYTLELFRWCQEQRIPFIYASSAATYGASDTFKEDLRYEKPLNVYGYSKFLFDQVLRREMEKELRAPAIGLRYFNVYGPMEQHKGRMASVAFHQFHQFKQDGKVKLFEGCLGYPNGGQKRDFVYVDDVVAVNMHFLNQPVSGIYNCGTGRAQEFNDVSLTVVNTLREAQGKPQLTLEEAVSGGAIEYIPFPEALVGKYQAFTQADLTNLRDAGCDVQFKTVQEGTRLYMLDLIKRYGL
jgi:ADP-L-glycero-D-manno-heptose 6-epimerase